MNLVQLLALFNSTVNTLDNNVVDHNDTKRLLLEVDQTTMGGCAYDCCNERPFLEVRDVKEDMYCSNRFDYFVKCRRFVKLHDTVDRQINASLCYQQHFAQSFPFVFRNAESTLISDIEELDGELCKEVINEADLDFIDDLLQASSIFAHLQLFEDDALKFSEQNLLTACFWPEIPPRNFDSKIVRKAHKTKKEVLNVRLQYVKEDILTLLTAYNYKPLCSEATVPGSGIGN